jgi:hypothetical protein
MAWMWMMLVLNMNVIGLIFELGVDDQVFQLLSAGLWFPHGVLASSTNKTDHKFAFFQMCSQVKHLYHFFNVMKNLGLQYPTL